MKDSTHMRNFIQTAAVLCAAAPAAAPGAAPAAEEPKAEEKTEFDVKLAGFDAAAKIKVIKEVRVITSLGLKEAKELVRMCPLQYCNWSSLEHFT